MNLTMRYQQKNYCCPEDQILTFRKKQQGIEDMLFFIRRPCFRNKVGGMSKFTSSVFCFKTSAKIKVKGCFLNNPEIQVNLDI